MRRLIPFAATLLLVLLPLYARGLSSPQADGTVIVAPDVGVAGNYGTWTVTYRAGAEGIAEGGGIRVQLPDTWHAGDRNSANPLQATKPRADHYVSSRSSRDGVTLQTVVEGESDDLLVKSARPGLDGRSERYVFVVRVRVVQGTLRPGDELSVVYGDTSAGSRGMRAAIVSTKPEPILLAVDARGSGRFERHPDRPTIRAVSGPPAELLVHGASDAVVGQPAELRVAVVDALANPAPGFQDGVRLEVVQGGAEVAAVAPGTLARGWAAVPFTPKAAGILRVRASALGGMLKAASNPIRVNATEPARRVYWGDLHSHSQHSWDGVGSAPFEYAREVSGLDFYALTDHSSTPAEPTRGLGPHVWQEYNAPTERHNEAGRFVTLHAYEASFGTPYGHHNVYFRGSPGPLLAPGDKIGLPELWQALTAGQALTVPHHTGKFPGGVRFDVHDAEFRRNFAIAAHGTDVIEQIQVLRYSRPSAVFEVIHSIRPDALDVTWSSVDDGFRGDAIYYVRLRQRGHVGGRIAMAWSSPIWVRRDR